MYKTNLSMNDSKQPLYVLDKKREDIKNWIATVNSLIF